MLILCNFNIKVFLFFSPSFLWSSSWFAAWSPLSASFWSSGTAGITNHSPQTTQMSSSPSRSVKWNPRSERSTAGSVSWEPREHVRSRSTLSQPITTLLTKTLVMTATRDVLEVRVGPCVAMVLYSALLYTFSLNGCTDILNLSFFFSLQRFLNLNSLFKQRTTLNII